MRRLDLSFRSVQSLLTVARMRSFTEAAHALNLTQPAVTQSVAKLEERLGCRLLDRTGSHPVLTQAGRALLADFERIEKSVETVFQRARGLERPSRETVRIGAPTSLIANIVVPVMAELAQTDPSIYVTLLEVDDDSVYDLIRAGDIDIALTSMTGFDAELDASPLLDELPCVVFPRGHALEGSGPATPGEVARHKIIRLPLGTIANSFTDALCEQAGVELDFATEATRLMTLDSLIRAGIGIAIVPLQSAQLICQGALTYRILALDGVLRRSKLIRSPQLAASTAAHLVAKRLLARSEALKCAEIKQTPLGK